MAGNTFLTAPQIAAAALGLLRRDIVLPATVYRNVENNFRAGSGATVNIRKPATAVARTYSEALRDAGTQITVDPLTETLVPVVMDTHIYSAVACTDEQLTLSIVNFGAQVLDPQTVVVAEASENVLAAKMNALAPGADPVTIAADGGDAHAAIIKARMLLNKANVPAGDRFLAVSPDVEAALLTDPERRLVTYDGGGPKGQTALTDAIVGRLYGFTILTSNALTAKTAVAYHRDAFAFVMRAPVVPDGAPFGKSAADSGIAMRWIRDYDAAFLRDRSIVSTLAGATTLDANRAVKIVMA
jgi:hypothetical protein